MTDHRPTVMSWKPTAEAVGVNGKPLQADADFFVSPPAEVGRVASAWSDVRRGQNLWPLPVKLGLAAICGAIAAAVIVWFKTHMPPDAKPNALQVIIVLAPLCVAIWALAMAFKKKWVGYVGDQGAAVYSTRGTREAVVGQSVRFAEVADVRLAITGKHKNWVDWSAVFVGADGTTLMKLRGNARMVGGKASFNPTYGIASAAHKAWEKHSGKTAGATAKS